MALDVAKQVYRKGTGLREGSRWDIAVYESICAKRYHFQWSDEGDMSVMLVAD